MASYPTLERRGDEVCMVGQLLYIVPTRRVWRCAIKNRVLLERLVHHCNEHCRRVNRIF